MKIKVILPAILLIPCLFYLLFFYTPLFKGPLFSVIASAFLYVYMLPLYPFIYAGYDVADKNHAVFLITTFIFWGGLGFFIGKFLDSQRKI